MSRLHITAASGTVTVQDRGRPGLLAQGLSRGGAADPVALAEGAALLRQAPDLAAIEVMGGKVALRLEAATRVAFTGAEMRAATQDGALAWHASHALPAGAELTVSALAGGFGYVHFGGGVEAPMVMGARSAHLAGGVGRVLQAGDALVLGADAGGPVDQALDPIPRFDGGVIRAVESLQTGLYPPEQVARLQQTDFRRDSHGNRMGARLDLNGAAGFGAEGGLTIVSDIVQPGDIQVTGDGTPFVLLAECQTMGGYPRIATVLPCDLPIVAQAAPGAPLRIQMVSRDQAMAAMAAHARALAGLGARLRPRLRRPDTAALLAVNLISGVVDARQTLGKERQ